MERFMEYIAFHERNDKESNSPFALRGVTKNIICIVRTIMPAYFSITFELNKGRDAIDSFCKTLIHSGLVFKSGYWGFENDSFDDIITWNQNRLDKNFQLGYTEHHSHDYKQMLFDYFNFSEVRLFVMNNRKERTFSFELIVPDQESLV
ncbi:MAG: hypothetical protein HFI24_10755 [Lachnospiraceae bacterium]|nr:hypothetical protein [Lachnospiraceae bacterium]